MCYITILLLTTSIASTTLCMQPDKEEMALKWAFAKLSHLQKTPAAQLKVFGLPQEQQTAGQKAKLKTALLEAVKAVELELHDDQNPLVAIDLDKLMALARLAKEKEPAKDDAKIQITLDQRNKINRYAQRAGKRAAETWLKSDKSIRACNRYLNSIREIQYNVGKNVDKADAALAYAYAVVWANVPK